jgi:tetratricopeptide (TPR) repeat protein
LIALAAHRRCTLACEMPASRAIVRQLHRARVAGGLTAFSITLREIAADSRVGSAIAEACRLARLEAERDDADTIWQAAWTLFFLAGEVAMAAAALDRALALNPNAAHAWLARGHINASSNQPEAAIEALERGRRLSPFDPYTFLYATTIGVAHFAARRFEQAIEWADRTLHDQPRNVSAMRTKVAANAHLGHLDEARAELSRLLAVDPNWTIADFLRRYAHILAPEVLELWVAGFRLAGLPER